MKKSVAIALVVFGALSCLHLLSHADANLAGRACEVVLLDPATGSYADRSLQASCDDALAASRPFNSTRRYGRIADQVYSLDDFGNQLGRIEATPVEGPIVLDRLRPYLDGAYASDGEAIFYGWRRVMTVSPPVDATKMRQLTRAGIAHPGYVTDGHWVLYEHQVLEGADPASFEIIPLPPGSNKEDGRYGGERGNVLFGSDAKHVYFGAQRVGNADPASFRLVYVSTESVGLDRGFWAFDRNAVWHLFDGSLTQADPEEATALRPRLSGFKAPLTERYPFLTHLVWPACVLILFGILGGTALIERRVWRRYKASTFEKPVAMLVTASLLLPSFLYAVIFDSCHAPDDVVVHWFVAGMLGISVISLGVLNFAAMDRLSAIGVTAVQIAVIGAALVIGLAVPSVVHLLSSLPRGGMGACR